MKPLVNINSNEVEHQENFTKDFLLLDSPWLCAMNDMVKRI